jgi:hypothetical protein
MKSFLKKNQLAYLILFILLGLFALLFMRAWPNRELQRQLTLGFGITYFVWGVLTHVKSKKINSEIIFEYLAISMLAVLIIVLITL